jgi:hypothetical protein
MNKGPLRHILVWVLMQSAIEMMDKMHDQGLDMLSEHGQDDLHQLVFAVEEMHPVMESVYHFLH